MGWQEFGLELYKAKVFRSACAAWSEAPSLTDHNTVLLYRKYKADTLGKLPSKIYGLVTKGNLGLVLPVPVVEGRPESCPMLECNAVQAIRNANQCIQSRLTPSISTILRLDFPLPPLEIHGASLGLAAALAMLQYASDLPIGKPVICTGELSESGLVQEVGSEEVKVDAAISELGDNDGLILIPDQGRFFSDARIKQVTSLDDAIHLVWENRPPLNLMDSINSLDEFLKKIKRSHSHTDNIQKLEARLEKASVLADQLPIKIELMDQHRHIGDMKEAKIIEDWIIGNLSGLHGLTQNERAQLQLKFLANQRDFYHMDGIVAELHSTLSSPNLDKPIQIEAQALLAMCLSITNDYGRAVELREQNLALQRQLGDKCKNDIGRTLCDLVLESARAGLPDKYDKYARELNETGNSQDYNDRALCLGAVYLGKLSELHAYLTSQSDSYPCLTPSLRSYLKYTLPVTNHPQISTLRALIRACRKCEDWKNAELLGSRCREDLVLEPHVRFLAVLCGLERDLALWEMRQGSIESIQSAPERFQVFPSAREFYSALMEALRCFNGSPESLTKLERQIDFVYN